VITAPLSFWRGAMALDDARRRASRLSSRIESVARDSE